MARRSEQFVCRSCGSVHPRWMGKCPDCGEWDALEARTEQPAGEDRQLGAAAVLAPATPTARRLSELAAEDPESVRRMSTGIAELDRVLGTSLAEDPPAPGSNGAAVGLVPGSAVLIGGDPGVGKSTLMLQAAAKLAIAGRRVLYVTSEESAQQLRLRAQRIGVPSDLDEMYVLADTNLARIIEQARKLEPSVVVVDSIQMIYKSDLSAAPGSVSQLRTCSQELVYLAKITGAAVLLVGHVTKQGQLAGPRLIAHMVDVVLYFEGDRYHSFRVLRAIKNRFGATLEVGLFEMSEEGLRQSVESATVPAGQYRGASGSIVCPVLHGSRCLLLEIQALTATGILGAAKRKTTGLDGSRLAMLIAVLEKHGGLRLADQDIFASSVGGVRVTEPAADLSLALAIAGAHGGRRLVTNPDRDAAPACVVGEVGLGGEIRPVQQMSKRFHEAVRLGFTQVVCPPTQDRLPKGCRRIDVRRLDEALALLAGSAG